MSLLNGTVTARQPIIRHRLNRSSHCFFIHQHFWRYGSLTRSSSLAMLEVCSLGTPQNQIIWTVVLLRFVMKFVIDGNSNFVLGVLLEVLLASNHLPALIFMTCFLFYFLGD